MNPYEINTIGTVQGIPFTCASFYMHLHVFMCMHLSLCTCICVLCVHKYVFINSDTISCRTPKSIDAKLGDFLLCVCLCACVCLFSV